MKHFNLLACSLLTAGVLCIVSVAWAAEVSPQEADHHQRIASNRRRGATHRHVQ